jgi:hypothetical protein
LPFFSQKNPAIGAAGRQPLAFQSRNGLDGGGVRYAKAPGNISWARLATGDQQVGDEFDIVLEQGA